MDGSAPISPVAAALAAVAPSFALQTAQAEVRAHDEAAEAAIQLIRAIDAEPEGAPRREDRLRQARLDRLKALDDASKARVRAAPLLRAHRAELVKVLTPLADKIAAALCEQLDLVCENLAEEIAQHNALTKTIGRAGGVVLPLPRPTLPDGFSMLVKALTAFSESRARQAAAGGKRRLFGRRH